MCIEAFLIGCLKESAGMNDDLCCVACCQDTSTITTEDTTNDKNETLLGQVHVKNPITGDCAPPTTQMIR